MLFLKHKYTTGAVRNEEGDLIEYTIYGYTRFDSVKEALKDWTSKDKPEFIELDFD